VTSTLPRYYRISLTAYGYAWACIALFNERQQLTITGVPTGGTFTLTYNGQTTSAIAYDANAATVQAALAALSNIGVGNVAVTGGPLPASPLVVESPEHLRGATSRS
jgi:hypothetical protein